MHKAAAQYLTPAVLELGGKNPTIVHSSANVKTAARRIAFGRFVNSGQICTAPDHVLVWPVSALRRAHPRARGDGQTPVSRAEPSMRRRDE